MVLAVVVEEVEEAQVEGEVGRLGAVGALHEGVAEADLGTEEGLGEEADRLAEALGPDGEVAAAAIVVEVVAVVVEEGVDGEGAAESFVVFLELTIPKCAIAIVFKLTDHVNRMRIYMVIDINKNVTV